MQLARGKTLVEILKQGQYTPMPVEHQIIQIFAATNGFMDEISANKIARYLKELEAFIKANKTELTDEIKSKKILDECLKTKLKQAIEEFTKTFKG